MADVEISYKGEQIATMSASGVKTLLTGDTFCEDDIVVEYTKPSAPAPTLQSKTVSPSTSQQVVSADSGYDGLSDVTVNPMPSGSATTPATSITANPTISVSSSGLITASVSGSKSVTPTVSAGYVSSGTAGTVTVNGSATQQISDPNLIAENIKKDVVLFGITGTYEGSGGSVNKVLLYTQSNFDNLYVDSSCTVTLLESCDYDYHAAFDVLLNADVIVVQIKNSNHYYFPTQIFADFVDDSVEVDLRNPVNGSDVRIYAF